MYVDTNGHADAGTDEQKDRQTAGETTTAMTTTATATTLALGSVVLVGCGSVLLLLLAVAGGGMEWRTGGYRSVFYDCLCVSACQCSGACVRVCAFMTVVCVCVDNVIFFRQIANKKTLIL